MKYSPEYILSRQLSNYLSWQYPKVIFHFDMTGVGLSKAQAGMMKAIQKRKGFPDLFIAEPRNGFAGLFIELKADGIRLTKRNGEHASDHIAEQSQILDELIGKGYAASFACGFDQSKELIDAYLKGR